MWNNSAIGSFLNAKSKYDSTDDEKKKDELGGVMANSVMSGLMSVGQGINGILNPALQAAEIGDTTMQKYDIANVANMGNGNYYDWDQLGADYANANMNIGGYDADDVRGMTTGEKWESVGTGALAGAKAGYEVGGFWGGLAGGVIGAGGALAGVISGNRKAQREAINLNNQADIAQQYAQQNFASAFESVADRQNRIAQSHIAAKGGKISQAAKGKHMTIQQFADSVLAKQNADKYSTVMNKHKFSAGGKTYNTHGGYFAPDIVKIEAGGTHEQNPFGGIQLGVDPMGVPNLVEEGEIIYDDYVFSGRLNASESLLKEFALPRKYAGKSFAYIADKLSDEAKERPNDAVSNNGLGSMYDRLMAAQDAHKAKLEESKLKREIKKMSPEELEAMGQAMAIQAVPQEEPMMQQPEVMPMQQAPVMAANGGQLANLYPWGDRMIKRAQDEKEKARLREERMQRQRLLRLREDEERRQKQGPWIPTNPFYDNTFINNDWLQENDEQWDAWDNGVHKHWDVSGSNTGASASQQAPTRLGGSSYDRSAYDQEYSVPYINLIDYMKGQVGPDGKLTPEGQAMLDRINEASGKPMSYNDWLKNATDHKSGAIHNATYNIAQDWSDSLPSQRDLAPIEKLDYSFEPNFSNTEIVRNPELEQQIREDRINRLMNPQPTDSSEVEDTPLLPTWQRYAGVGYNLLSAANNLLQEPDRYEYRRFTPDTAEGSLALDRLQYNPYDFNLAANQINANAAATNSAIANSGSGPSTNAALLAANYNNSRNLGNAYWQTQLANNQQLANVTAANNQAAQAEADFDYRRNLGNTQIRNQAGMYNLQNAIQTDYLNKQAEAQKWQAVSQSMDAAARDLAGIGQENFNFNMANTNPALFYNNNPYSGRITYDRANVTAEGGELKKNNWMIDLLDAIDTMHSRRNKDTSK